MDTPEANAEATPASLPQAPETAFGQPRLHTGARDEERHATWQELFFDLVFVVAVAALAHLLQTHMTLSGLAVFAGLFVPVWWQWIDFSYYADQFDTEDVSSNLVTLLVMFGVIVLSVTIYRVPQGGSASFAEVYAALRVVIILLYAWAWRHVPESRELTARYTLSFLFALAVWIVSLAAPEPGRFWLWGLALLLEIGNGPLTYATIKNVPTQISHMDERFGLFVLIVLGEAVVAVAEGVADVRWHLPVLATAFGGFVLRPAFWWLYFVRADFTVINQALRGSRSDLLRSYLYGYSHFLIFAGVTATGVGIQTAIETAQAETLSLPARAALAGGAAMFLLGVEIVHWATPDSLPSPVVAARLLGAAAGLGLLFAGGGLPPPLFLGLLLALCLGLIGFEWLYARRCARSRPNGGADGEEKGEVIL